MGKQKAAPVEKTEEPQSRFKTAISNLKPSITGMDRGAAWAMAIEAVFCATVYLIYRGITQTIEWIKPGFEAIDLNRDDWAGNPLLIQKAYDGVISVLWKIGIAAAIWILVFLAAYCIFNSLIWAKLSGKKADYPWIRRWVWTTIPWTIAWAVLFVLMAIAFKPEWYNWTVPIWFILYEYLTMPLHMTLTKEDGSKGWDAMKRATGIAILDWQTILWPMMIWLVAYLLITSIIDSVIDLTGSIALLPYLIIMTIWLRRYAWMCQKPLLSTNRETFK
ncbi:MAG: hypothetical protein AABX47_00080 [Nanoarchaeota archaeon]